MLPLSASAQNAAPASPIQLAPAKVRLMTWNIRNANSNDEAAGRGWPQRRARVFETIKSHAPDVLCVQEVLAVQMDDLTAALPDYEHFGVGRDDGQRAGEFALVFFKRDRFERLETQTMWLSPTPDVPSRGWDAVLPRVATRVRLRDRTSGTSFNVWSTHFDHVGKQARLESANLLRSSVTNASVPTIVAGDLNIEPTDPGYPAMIAHQTLRDARMASESTPTGSKGTFCDWGRPIKSWGPIDYVFVSAPVGVERFDVSVQGFEQAPNPSDHLPVIADLLLPTTPIHN